LPTLAGVPTGAKLSLAGSCNDVGVPLGTFMLVLLLSGVRRIVRPSPFRCTTFCVHLGLGGMFWFSIRSPLAKRFFAARSLVRVISACHAATSQR
jgi:hypothetical protein